MRKSQTHIAVAMILLVTVQLHVPGCVSRHHEVYFRDKDLHHFNAVATSIEHPDVHDVDDYDIRGTESPHVNGDEPPEFWDLPLQEAVELALRNSQVLRDLGGVVLRAPGNTSTVFDPAAVYTDPRFGEEAALSQFDASFAASAFFEHNDRALNNIFEGGGTRLFKQDLGLYNFELSKATAAGTDLTLRHAVDYDFNNAPGNNVPNLPWAARIEGQFRQPLLQGAGVDFGRINGRNGSPGFYNGVLIARVNTDISLAEFEASVAELISHVENAYWELYFAYRDLDAKRSARDRALSTWREVRRRYEIQQIGGEAEKEAQAREQFFRLDAEVQNALYGRHVEKSSQSSVFRGIGGVYTSERQLRLAIGLPASDGRLIRPKDEPAMVHVLFDWEEVLAESLFRRPELQRQRWQIKRRELELVGARNYLMPQLDAVGGYRFRGLGHDLLRTDSTGLPRFDNAYRNLTSGDFQEWQLGVELAVPIGNREAHTAVRNAELLLARERAVLRRQEQEVVSDLSDSYAELRRAFDVAKTNYNRRTAASQQLQALEAVYVDADDKERARLLDLILDAQRRLADAESNYFRSLSEYAVAIKNIHLEKGSLLDFNEIYLSEGPWPRKAYADAWRRTRSRAAASHLDDFVRSNPPIVSRGTQLRGPVAPGSEFEVIDTPSDESAVSPPKRLPAANEPPWPSAAADGGSPVILSPAPSGDDARRSRDGSYFAKVD